MSHLSQLQFAYGPPVASATIRSRPEDFLVREQLSFSLDEKGQHVFLLLEKRNLNTDQVVKLLAKFADVKPLAIGYAGMKDKHAVTSQWFSVDLAGRAEPSWNDFTTDEVRVLEFARHGRKLKRGAISANQFEILLKEFQGDAEELEQRLQKIKSFGVPNYFGEQRFGHNESNLQKAESLLKNPKQKIKRHLRGIYLSAARSFLFNQVLSRRVLDNTWNRATPGDVFMLDGSHSIFSTETIDDEIVKRLDENDIHPTGPMWGSGELATQQEVLTLEQQVISEYPHWCILLEREGLKQERRSLRLPVRNMAWEWKGGDLLLKFELPAGSYATSFLRELINY